MANLKQAWALGIDSAQCLALLRFPKTVSLGLPSARRPERSLARREAHVLEGTADRRAISFPCLSMKEGVRLMTLAWARLPGQVCWQALAEASWRVPSRLRCP